MRVENLTSIEDQEVFYLRELIHRGDSLRYDSAVVRLQLVVGGNDANKQDQNNRSKPTASRTTHIRELRSVR